MSVRKEKIIVAGGGLVGSLLAISLKNLGFEPLVLEKRTDPRKMQSGEEGRSINLVLTAKGLYALKQLGLDQEVLSICSPVYGRMMHSLAGELTYQPYGSDTDCNYSVSRWDLNKMLILKGLDMGIRYEFETTAESLDVEAGFLKINSDGCLDEIQADHVFATDGAGSKIRPCVVDQEKGEESVDFLDQRYKELLVPIEQAKKLDEKALHIWPRGHHMLMALINKDKSFTLTLYLDQNGQKFGFGYLDSAPKVREYFQTYFQDVIELVPNLETAFLANPVGKLGTVRSAPWFSADKVVCLGDASHGIVPFFGQGMNSGFQDVTVLVELWKEHKNWKKVFAKFYEKQKPNADAIADMALENFVEMSEKVGNKDFLFQKAVEAKMAKMFPEKYLSRYSLVMYGQTPYAVCKQAGLIQKEILQNLCADKSELEQVDWQLAESLIDKKLTPFFTEHEVQLNR